MALDLFTQVMQMKPADKSLAVYDSQSLKKNQQASNRDNLAANEKDRPQFGEVMEKVQHEQNGKPAGDDGMSAKTEDVRAKLEEVSARAEEMNDSANSIPAEVYDKIQALLKLIKTALETRFADENSALKGTGEGDSQSKMELMNALKDILAKLDKLLETNSDPAAMLKMLDSIQQEAAAVIAQNTKPKAEPQSPRSELRIEAASKPADASNVKVIDLRGREPVQPEIAAVDEPKSVKEILPKEKKLTNDTGGIADKTAHTRTEKNEAAQTAKFTLDTPDVKNGRLSEPAPFVRHYQSFANPVSRANIESIMHGVTGKAIVVLQEGRSEMRLNLSPPELGKMNMKFELENGELIGKIVVSTQEAKMLFDQNLGDLQKNLQDAGVNVTSLDVSLGQEENNAEEKDASSARNGGILTDELALDEEWTALSLYDSSVNLIA
ncbi:MAG: hypothetical protein A2Y33_09745 [Spirochaetes bacterium GWF1_51_8]|nr:MAG: hypothetical protein A2Y33_09745 [Spirochaetes bacterium GWF1_51_8]